MCMCHPDSTQETLRTIVPSSYTTHTSCNTQPCYAGLLTAHGISTRLHRTGSMHAGTTNMEIHNTHFIKANWPLATYYSACHWYWKACCFVWACMLCMCIRQTCMEFVHIRHVWYNGSVCVRTTTHQLAWPPSMWTIRHSAESAVWTKWRHPPRFASLMLDVWLTNSFLLLCNSLWDFRG